MKYKVKLLMFFILLSVSFSKILFAVKYENNVFIKGVRPMGMGGAFTAIADDENAFFYNCAGITQIYEDTLQTFSLRADVDNHVAKAYAFYNENKDDILHFEDLSPEKQGKFVDKIVSSNMLNCAPNVLVSLPNILFIKRPIDINKSRNSLNFGLGFFSYAKAIGEIDKGTLLPSLSYKGEITGVGMLPVAFRIYSLNSLNLPGVLSLGVNLKYMYRLVNSKEDLSLIEIGKFEFGGNFFDATAFGVDFGAIYYLNSRWHFGINATDLYNSQFKYKKSKIHFDDEKKSSSTIDTYDPQGINPILNIGCAYIPEKLYYWLGKYIYTNDNITFAFDLIDLNNPNESFSLTPFKKIHIGTECRLTPFSLRVGLNSGYPSFGAGISLKAVNLEYAFYGEEKGILPGQDPDWIHSFLVSIRLHWGNKFTKDEEKSIGCSVQRSMTGKMIKK
ncbi:MAG: conjugal transfer protein TraF [Endomicrobium sp.]|jgi:hypothetical protein|nr:conjugal transfer protein TraF [Endomicrobium sp.]